MLLFFAVRLCHDALLEDSVDQKTADDPHDAKRLRWGSGGEKLIHERPVTKSERIDRAILRYVFVWGLRGAATFFISATGLSGGGSSCRAAESKSDARSAAVESVRRLRPFKASEGAGASSAGDGGKLFLLVSAVSKSCPCQQRWYAHAMKRFGEI